LLVHRLARLLARIAASGSTIMSITKSALPCAADWTVYRACGGHVWGVGSVLAVCEGVQRAPVGVMRDARVVVLYGGGVYWWRWKVGMMDGWVDGWCLGLVWDIYGVGGR
jgi:hypothetical protein